MLPVLKVAGQQSGLRRGSQHQAFICHAASQPSSTRCTRRYAQMQELVKTAMQAAITGQSDPKAALDKAAADFNALVK